MTTKRLFTACFITSLALAVGCGKKDKDHLAPVTDSNGPGGAGVGPGGAGPEPGGAGTEPGGAANGGAAAASPGAGGVDGGGSSPGGGPAAAGDGGEAPAVGGAAAGAAPAGGSSAGALPGGAGGVAAGAGGTSTSGGASDGGAGGLAGAAGRAGNPGAGGTGGVLEPGCGNGVVEDAETCDDGGNIGNDGCSSSCQIEPGYSCIDEPSDCAVRCGDGVIGGAETCDDGERVDGDGCSDGCSIEVEYSCSGEPSRCRVTCGDGVLAPLLNGETCDDGNLVAGDGCSPDCQVESGSLWEAEPNNDAPTANFIGTGSIEVHGTLDPLGDMDMYRILLDGVSDLRVELLDPGTEETCDSVDLQVHLYAADGTSRISLSSNWPTCTVFDWEADDEVAQMPAGTYLLLVRHIANNVADYPYRLRVTVVATCGDEQIGGNEECDDPDPLVCDASCQRVPTCGDGFVDLPESCDDGGTEAGDGCSAECLPEFTSEIEPNDTPADAATHASAPDGVALTPGGLVGGALAANDLDYFELSLESPAFVYFHQTTEPRARDCTLGSDLGVLRLYDDVAAPVDDFFLRDIGSGWSFWNCVDLPALLPAGTYYAALNEASGRPMSVYRLQTDVIPLENVVPEVNNNHDQESAMDLTAYQAVVVEASHAVGEQDYFAVRVPPGMALWAHTFDGVSDRCGPDGAIESYMFVHGYWGEQASYAEARSSSRWCSLIAGLRNESRSEETWVVRVQHEPNYPHTSDTAWDYRLAVLLRPF
jgi:cysteine-rich repeat protein